ncbi:MAG: NAD kinase [Porphyromonas sp.]|nr:NAD kinase [Porphyromonas sp.]
MTVIIFGSKYLSKPLETLSDIFRIISESSVETWVHSDFLTFLESKKIPVNGIKPFTEMGALSPSVLKGGETIAISIGGDGTYLRTAWQVMEYKLPVLGVNLGRLGFLASISGDLFQETWQHVLKKEYDIVERSMIDIYTEKEGHTTEHGTVLNEVVVSKKDSGSMISIEAQIDGQRVATYLADGLIVSTPTGSTAYSLSVNGPIIAPNTSTLCLTPVAPHMLNMRPLVVADNYQIRLKVSARNLSFLLVADGKTTSLSCNTILCLKKSKESIKSIQIWGHNFYQTLRDKLMWGIDPREV